MSAINPFIDQNRKPIIKFITEMDARIDRANFVQVLLNYIAEVTTYVCFSSGIPQILSELL